MHTSHSVLCPCAHYTLITLAGAGTIVSSRADMVGILHVLVDATLLGSPIIFGSLNMLETSTAPDPELTFLLAQAAS